MTKILINKQNLALTKTLIHHRRPTCSVTPTTLSAIMVSKQHQTRQQRGITGIAGMYKTSFKLTLSVFDTLCQQCIA